MGILDGLLLVILIMSMLKGWKHGFIKTLYSVAGFMIAFFVARGNYLKISLWVQENTQWLVRIQSFVEKRFDTMLSAYFNTNGGPEAEMGKIGDFFQQYAFSSFDVQTYGQEALNPFKDSMITSFSVAILNIFCMIALFMAVRIGIQLAAAFLDQLFRLPILSTFNRLAGVLAGALSGVMTCTLLVGTMMLLIMIWPVGWIASLVENSVSIQWFFQHILSRVLTQTTLF